MSGRKKSWVWDFFEKTEDEKKATCAICGSVLCYNFSTSALNSHLIKIHKKCRENESVHSATACGIESNERPPKPKKRRLDGDACIVTVERQEEISSAVARFISSNMLPFSIVESEGFRDFMKVLEPGYKVPCVKSTRSRLGLLYKNVKDKLMKELADASSVSISVDEWSSRTLDCYVSVEAQYFNTANDLVTATLCNQQLEGRPNAENIVSTVEDILNEWNIFNKVQSITHDSASVMNSAADKLWNIPCSIQCTAHLLQLVVKDALGAVPQFTEICDKGKKISSHFHRSSVAKNALSTRQVQLGIKENRLVQSCEIRWNSKLHMCESLIMNRSAISLVLGDKNVTKARDAVKLELSEREWSEMENLIKVLKSFDKATAVLCSSKSLTMSLVRPLINRFIQIHMSVTSTDGLNEKMFKECAVRSIFKRFKIGQSTDKVSADLLATFLDPRYKSLHGEDVETKTKVYEFVKNCLANDKAENTPEAKLESTDLDFLFFDDILPNDATSQLDLYVAEPQVGHNIDPIAWWKTHCGIYPDIFKLAKSYLCIPATSAESERTFSISGNIVSQRRSCLLPQNVNLLTFLYQNRRLFNDVT